MDSRPPSIESRSDESPPPRVSPSLTRPRYDSGMIAPIFLVSTLLAQAPPAQTAPIPPPVLIAKPKPPGEDWVPLFNGKNLNGWINVGQEKWEVDEGTIHGIAVTQQYGYLQT